MTSREQIQQKAIELLKNNPQGIRYSQLVNMVKDNLLHIPINTIHGTIWNLDVTMPN